MRPDRALTIAGPAGSGEVKRHVGLNPARRDRYKIGRRLRVSKSSQVSKVLDAVIVQTDSTSIERLDEGTAKGRVAAALRTCQRPDR
jgi:hypothetical protein